MIPQERAQRIDEQIVVVPQEREQERIFAQSANIPVPPMMQETMEVVLITSHERDQEDWLRCGFRVSDDRGHREDTSFSRCLKNMDVIRSLWIFLTL